jgi:crotonobetainyl-CoA:carnitine CoA-transferase CaiB-like acyl-CoA transferase
VIASRSRAQWETAFGAELPCEPVLSVREALHSPHARARGLVAATESVDGLPLELPVLPLGWTSGGRVRRRPPRLGEHTTEVLDEWTSAARA